MLQADDGKPNEELNTDWCERYLEHPLLSEAERYCMMFKIFNLSRQTKDKRSRYVRIIFPQPAEKGEVDLMRKKGSALILDIGELSQETQAGVASRIKELESNPASAEACNVEKHLQKFNRSS